MKKIISFWREKTGIFGILALWLSFYAFVVWYSGRFFFYPAWFILSGQYWKELSEIFWKPFNWVHAGSALDQPTVGKFMFWYAVIALFTMIFLIAVRFLTDMKSKSNYRCYLFFFILAFLFVMSFMVAPATLLAHYIIDMGVTSRRLNGVICIGVSILAWPVLGWFLLRIKKPQKQIE